MIGNLILHYKILEKLGEGGMGVVYLAEDTRLQRQVAIKFLPQSIALDNEARKRFKIEAQAAAALNHPNITQIYTIEETDEQLFIVMEYIEGKELKEIISNPPSSPLSKGGQEGGCISIESTLSMATQIAEGLQAAHEKGIIHRDIKSSNIMITDDGKVKIMDFGLAKVGQGMQLTKEQSTLGTVAYMSPEQARGDEVDKRTDIWSFGVVLYEMLTGQPPFKGDYEQAVIYSILNEEPVFPDEVADNLEPILRKSLAKDQHKRYQNLNEILIDINSLNSVTTTRLTEPNKTWRMVFVRRKQIIIYSGIVILILFAGFIYFKERRQPIDTIAVLPFKNVKNDPETEYLSDGITESIINGLSQLPKLQVKARSIVFRYKGKEIDPLDVGRELNVGALLTGRVIQQGLDLNIQTELVDVRDGSQLWGKKYHKKISDLLVVQAEISKEISEKLLHHLSVEENTRLTKRNTENSEAYQLYLKGRYHWNKRSEVGVNKSLDYFQKAFEKDSTYALAYAGLGDSYLMLGVYGRREPKECFPIAKTYIEKALRLDSGLAEAYATLGDINIHFDWDLTAAERNLKKAIELNPRYPNGYHWNSEVLVLRRKFKNAYQESQHALELDPYALIINAQFGEHYRRGGEFQKAIDQLRKTIEFDSTFAYSYFDLGIVYVELKQYEPAVKNFRKANALAPSDTRILAALGFAEGISGNEREARRIERTLLNEAKRNYVPAYDLAVAALGLGKKVQAMQYLEEAFSERSPWIPFLDFNPLFENLQSNSKFQDILQKVGSSL
jgi:serine/threonine-protein kinase